jgi:GNAT superfamily N-acetyltransferase
VQIEPATPDNLSAIRAAYAHGRNTQREQASSVWPDFRDADILREIDAGQLFRVVADESLAGVFSLAHDDPAIWGSLERGAHIYLHRIARAADWNGRGLMDAILTWAAEQCSALGREGIRIDTWASNAPLIAFYERRGFRLLGTRRLSADPRLSPHYHGNEFALLEWTREPST